MPRDGIPLSFLTPYWSGREMMRMHLGSIRRFHPTSPILVSKRGGEREEMDAHRTEFAIQYWLEECDYTDALLRLLERCDTEYVCIVEHDTALLSSLDGLVAGIRDGRWDLVGMEERVRDSPATADTLPSTRGWWRFAPGQASGPLLLFNWEDFRRRWGLRGVAGSRSYGAWEYEYDHGIGQKLRRHKYLLPYHAPKYGMGNLLKDGDTAVLWHQWYGSYRTRLARDRHTASDDVDLDALVAHARAGEAAFLADYPNLDLSTLTPAWGPDFDIRLEQLAAERARAGPLARGRTRLGRWLRRSPAEVIRRVATRWDRWRRLRRVRA